MVFDKTKAMRNAERFLAQGKIASAIGELKQVIAHDSKDFGTLNMLGDLYTKNLDNKLAAECYALVAEHYSKQGFAQKGIAVYNKILRMQPDSIDIAEKLADLYKFKGAVNEARMHYKMVADRHESEGRKLDALETRKQIASLDPNDTTVYLNIAAAYVEENQQDDAADAFTEAALRFAKKSQHSEALEALEKALDIKPTEPKILVAFVQSHFANGTPAAAAERLVEIQLSEPYNQDVLGLLIDCHLEADETVEAEKAIISLVEKEPASYPRFLDLARVYLKKQDADAASRTIAMSAEHLLAAGQATEFQALLTEILALDPDQIEGLRLRARLAAWQRDEAEMLDSLTQLARIAKEKESVDDERFALSQLVMIAPHEVEFADRLREINKLHGFDDTETNDNLFDKQFLKARQEAAAESEADPTLGGGFEAKPADNAFSDFAIVANSAPADNGPEGELIDDSDEARLLREIESIRFYVDSDYFELAEKAVHEIKAEFGERPEIAELTNYLLRRQGKLVVEADPVVAVPVEVIAPEPVAAPSNGNGNGNGNSSSSFGIDDLRSELGIDEPEVVDDSDYDTHYHTAVAYQEMGLLDEAVKEYQEAVGLVQPNDPTRRFFHCANLLGHCFMQKGMPNLALTWYRRALETPGLTDEEKQGIWYELATAHEADGDTETAVRYFEQVYAENINFRDVSERVKNIAVSR